MTLPDLRSNGFLPDGQWPCSPEDFMARFCTGDRERYRSALESVWHFARRYGARRVLVGGSFVSSKEKPTDIDIVVVFPTADNIPDDLASTMLQGHYLDAFYASEDQPDLVGSLVQLFSTERLGQRVGIVDVQVAEDLVSLAQTLVEPSTATLEAVIAAYTNRHIFHHTDRKLLVTVHGIRSQGAWNMEVCHVASSRGWIVAPFIYEEVGFDIFADRTGRRERIVDQFREFISDMDDRYQARTSVIAHSFGTYIVAKYCAGFDEALVQLDTLIFTGCVLSPSYDLTRFDGKIRRLINEVAPNDSAVDWARVGKIADMDFGNAGKTGFASTHPLLAQREAQIFGHNNVIRRDVMSKRWMPWLEANAAVKSVSLPGSTAAGM